MKRSLLTGILLAGCCSPLLAQTVEAEAPKEKKFDHYFAVQLNDLLRQVFTFNATTAAANTNPFLFTYNLSHHKTGWGLRAGVGATISSSSSNDNITKRNTDINNMQVRLGVEKMCHLSDKWTAGAGIDMIMKNNQNKTTAVTNQTYTVTVNTTTTETSTGGGAMAWLRYNISSRILIGTETSFYYTSGKIKQTVISTDDGPFQNYSETKTDNGASEGKLSVPVVFYLTVKL